MESGWHPAFPVYPKGEGMIPYLTIYLLVLSYGFVPHVVGFGSNESFIFSTVEEVAVKVYEIKEVHKERINMKLFKIELLAEDKPSDDGLLFKTTHKETITEIEIPQLKLQAKPLTKELK